MLAAIHISTSDWISVAGTVIAVVSLVIAIVQGKRATDAKRAAIATTRQIAARLLLEQTADLEGIVRRLRGAAHAAKRKTAQDEVEAWSRAAAEHQALVEQADARDAVLSRHLQLSLGLVETVLRELGDTEVEPEAACQRMLYHARNACVHSRRIGTAMMFRTE